MEFACGLQPASSRCRHLQDGGGELSKVKKQLKNN
jgi:hypothetical protein